MPSWLRPHACNAATSKSKHRDPINLSSFVTNPTAEPELGWDDEFKSFALEGVLEGIGRLIAGHEYPYFPRSAQPLCRQRSASLR